MSGTVDRKPVQAAPPACVSVLLPTYNRTRFLPEAIDSVLAQTYPDFELIVVDDGSTDDTAERIAEVDDPRLRYTHRPHRGISAALNTGLRLARGRYVARLDSDDTWKPETLATLVPVLEDNPELGFVYGRGRAMQQDGTPIDHVQGLPPRYPDDSLASLLFDDCTCNVALLARRDCLDRAGLYDERLEANEDWDMWLRVARHAPFRFVDRELAWIRWHDENLTGLSSSRLADVLATRRIPLDKIYSLPDLPQSARDLRNVAYTNVRLYIAQRWRTAGESKRARRALWEAVRGSANPPATLIRAVWLATVVPALRRTRIGARLVRELAAVRRRIRERRRSE